MNKLDKYRHGEFGYVKLTDVVNEYMNDSYNDGRKYFTNILLMAARSWQRLVRTTLKLPVNKIIYVDKSTNTVVLPANFDGPCKVYVIDECNKLQELFYDENHNVVEIPPPPAKKGCGCAKCNCDNEVCTTTNQVNYLEEDVVINSITYKKITQTKICSNGDIIEEIAEPIAEGDGEGGFTVITRNYKNYIAKVDVKPCGCIINVPSNNQKLIDSCGCAVICCRPKNQIPIAFNKRGHYKLDLERGVIHLINVKEKKVLLVYQASFENEYEIMVPEYTLDFLTTDIHFRSMRFRSNVSDSKIDKAEQRRNKEEKEVREFLGPINMQELNAFKSSHFPKW